jgi:hypothetical protein
MVTWRTLAVTSWYSVSPQLAFPTPSARSVLVPPFGSSELGVMVRELLRLFRSSSLLVMSHSVANNVSCTPWPALRLLKVIVSFPKFQISSGNRLRLMPATEP